MTAPVITAWSAASGFGIGRAAFETGARGGGTAAVTTPDPELPPAVRQACMVPDLDPRDILDGRGLQHLDRASLLALVAVGELVDREAGVQRDVGVVLGTTSGSAETETSIRLDSLRKAKPHSVSALKVPSATMNCAAAQCAIRYGLTGPNSTIAGGRAAVLHALAYTRRLLAAGRAARVVTGAVEEHSRTRAWLAHHGGTLSGPWLGEGAVTFLVEPGGGTARPLAEIRSVRTRLCHDGAAADALTACVRSLLEGGDVAGESVWAAVPVGGGPRAREALAAVCGEAAVREVAPPGRLGDAGSVSAAFGLAAVLVAADADPSPRPRPVVIVSAEPVGQVTAALLVLPPRS